MQLSDNRAGAAGHYSRIRLSSQVSHSLLGESPRRFQR